MEWNITVNKYRKLRDVNEERLSYCTIIVKISIYKTTFSESVVLSGELIFLNIEIHPCMFCVNAHRSRRMSTVRKCACSRLWLPGGGAAAADLPEQQHSRCH